MVSKKIFMSFMLIAVIGLAGAGCSDDNPVDPANIDEAPVIPPTKLTVKMDRGKANLEWGPSVDSRVVNYFVDRENGGNRVSLGKTGKSETRFVDESPALGHNTYYVYAAGAGARKSSSATVSITITRAHRNENVKD